MVGSFSNFFLQFHANLGKFLKNNFHFFPFRWILGNHLGEIFSFLFCFKQTWGRLLAFYAFVFQAYLKGFLETWFSQFLGFGHANLGRHHWRPSLKGFKGTLEGSLWDFFKNDFKHNHPCHLWKSIFEIERRKSIPFLPIHPTCWDKIVVCILFTLLHLIHYTKHHFWNLISF
jgi:hypothetical protein